MALIQKTLLHGNGNKLTYRLRYSKRARYMRLSLDAAHGLTVTLPRWAPEQEADRFIRLKLSWITKHLSRLTHLSSRTRVVVTKAEFEQIKQEALTVFSERVAYFNSLYKFSYKAIRVRNQKSLWGSCSRDGNLQFNVKLIKLPLHLLDYVVVHELCHLEEHNHKASFWRLVSRTIPQHKKLRQELRQYSMA